MLKAGTYHTSDSPHSSSSPSLLLHLSFKASKPPGISSKSTFREGPPEKQGHSGQERGRIIIACCSFYHLAIAGEVSPSPTQGHKFLGCWHLPQASDNKGYSQVLARLWGLLHSPLYTGKRNGRNVHPKTTRYTDHVVNGFFYVGPGETKSFQLSWDAKQVRSCEHYSRRNESLPQAGRDRMEVTPRAPPIS